MTNTRVLLVGDEQLNLEILVEYFEGEEAFALITANCGEAAWQLLINPEHDFNLVQLYHLMPSLNAMCLLRRMKGDRRLTSIPVIMQTAANSSARISEGMEASAYDYLAKPYRCDSLLAIVHAALSNAHARSALNRKLHQHINSLQFCDRADFSIHTVEEAGQLASFIAQACPNPDAPVTGISELLIIGIEHGDIGLTHVGRSRLTQEDSWHDEISRRASLPENSANAVHLSYFRDADTITLRIREQGGGFSWHDYLDMAPQRAFDPNGRGRALAHMLSLNSVANEGCGNIAVATICRGNDNYGVHLS